QAGPHGELCQQLLSEIAVAQFCLLDPQQKAAYDAHLCQGLGRRGERTVAAAPPPGSRHGVQPAAMAPPTPLQQSMMPMPPAPAASAAFGPMPRPSAP